MLLSQLNNDDDEDDGNYDDKNNDDDIDGETRFYRDLEEAKKAKLGASIPKKQLEESASRAQEEFLQAMKEASQEFKEAKEELGSEGAIDLFLNRIRKEDEKRESGINDDDVCDDDLLGEFEWLLRFRTGSMMQALLEVFGPTIEVVCGVAIIPAVRLL